MAPFVYEQLVRREHEIRLLKLISEPSDQVIKCELSHFNLDDSNCPAFEALSYCWGDPSDGKNLIELNGAPFAIAANLQTALLQLRRSSEGRNLILWVDAICINQSTEAIEERNAQVSIMLHIYARSQRVIIWLGEADPDTESAFNSIREPVRHARHQPGSLDSFAIANNPQALGYGQTSLSQATGSMLFSYISDGPVNALFELVTTRPWFNRLWIVQELAVAPQATLMCGPHELDWTEIEALVAFSTQRIPHIERLVEQRRIYQNPGGYTRSDLARLVVLNRTCGASDQRDRIYAVWGLAEHVSGAEGVYSLKPDYSLDTNEVYRLFTVEYLKNSGSLNLLTAIPQSHLRPSAQPSWVWNDTRKAEFDVTNYAIYSGPAYLTGFYYEFEATEMSSSETTISGCGRYLSCLGQILDVIDEVGKHRPATGAGYQDHMTHTASLISAWSAMITSLVCFVNWYHLAIPLRSQEPPGMYTQTGERLCDAFWQVCCASVPYNDYFLYQNAFEAFEAVASPFLRLPERLRESRLIYGSLLICKIIELLLRAVLLGQRYRITLAENFVRHSEMSINRRLFRTHGRLLGMGPTSMRKGDVVVLMKGARVPMVVRRSERNATTEKHITNDVPFDNVPGQTYELVGECLIHGIMYGEVYDESKCASIWLQ